ncbi:ankyrin [Elaphomyces granulatus]
MYLAYGFFPLTLSSLSIDEFFLGGIAKPLSMCEVWHTAKDRLAVVLEEFQQHLSPEQEAQLKSITAHDHTPDATDVLQLTDEINKKNSTRKSRVLADRVQEFLNSVQQYCNMIDTCTGLNQTAALAWSCVKLAILITSNFAEYFEKLSKSIAQISVYCPRISEYEKIFGGSARLQHALSDFYAIIVLFCSKALLVVQEKGIKRFAKSLWKTFKADFGELEENISAAREEVSEEIKLASEQAEHEFRQFQMIETRENQVFRLLQSTEAEENQRFRSQQISFQEQTRDRRVQKIVMEEERHRIRLLQKVQNYDYNRSLRNAQRSRCEGTCLWLFQRAEFKEWIGQKSDSLACYGIRKFILFLLFPRSLLTNQSLKQAGCGKTVLMGSVHDFLKRKFSSNKDTTIVYYFFDYSTKASLAVSTFLRSILHQILTVKKLSAVQVRLESLFSGDIEQWEVDPVEVATLFSDFCSAYKRVFLLLDGLDEIDPRDGRVIRNFLKKFEGIASVKVFITTHPEVDMSTVFRRCRTFKIEAHDVEPDIATFVESQIEQRSQEELSGCSPTLLELIQQALISGAQGMFLWVDLQIREICTAAEEDGTLDGIPKLLLSLPRTIEEIYSFALKRLISGGDKLEQARNVFQWIAFARRPLTMGEIEEAINITIDQKSWKSPEIKLTLSRLCKICGNLVDVDESKGTISLAHHTVLDFLLCSSEIASIADFRITDLEAQCYLAEICITYLRFVDFRTSLVRTPDARNLENLSRPINLLMTTTPQSSWLSAAFQSVGNRHGERKVPFDLVDRMRKEISVHQPARINPSFQLLEYCRTYWHDHSRHLPLDNQKLNSFKAIMLEQNLPFDYKPWDSLSDLESLPHWKMFSWAVRQAHALVLQTWKDIVTENEAVNYWRVLWSRDGAVLFSYACSSGNVEQISIILQACKRDRSIMRPSEAELCRGMVDAARLGHIDTIELLLQEKADVNTAPARDCGRTALQAAAESGHLAVVERLLQEKADVNAAPAEVDGKTALQAAAEGGHLAVVERLLQEKSDVNAAPAETEGRTALQAAAGGGHLAVVERLLQEKSDVNAAPAETEGRTALQAAAEGGHLAVVERLLQEKSDVNAAPAETEGRTALQAAAEGGHLAVVELLLQEKADVNAAPASFWGRTALQAAAEGGHLAVVERLLQEKSDVNAAPAKTEGRTALQAAAEGGHLAVVELLLQEKADVNAAPASFWRRTALQAAAEGGHLAVVERLLQEKSDVNVAPASFRGRTALQVAAEGGHLAVVERLLQEKADVNAAPASFRGRTALQAAANGGHLAVVERLLQEKADVNAAPAMTDGRTALQAAAEGGHLAVVERLLQEKANVNAAPATTKGRTALQEAAEGGHLAVVERLLQEKADVNAAPIVYGGRTALQAAESGRHLAVVERLRAAGAM